MLGGGIFTTQNKILPGCYINFISTAKLAATLGERGIVALPVELDWGTTEVMTLDNGTLVSSAKEILGYSYDNEKLVTIREVMKNATRLYLYRLNGSGDKATCVYADAKYAGTRGNDIKIVISANVDEPTKFNVETYLDTVRVDAQVVASATELKANNFVTFKADATLEVTAGVSLTGGTNSAVTGESYTNALTALESYSFNALGIMSDEETTKNVAVAYVKRMRDEVGAKFQLIVHDVAADYEGVINVDDLKAVPWVTGAIASAPINKSLTNKVYDGELTLVSSYSQVELEKAIKSGKFVFHKVGDTVNVLSDINSFVSVTADKTSDFSANQVIRVLDEVANTTASIFNKTFLGKVQNNADGRIALKSMLVSACEQMQNIGAIQNFSSEDITVEEGNLKKSVAVNWYITPVMAMEQLYCVVKVN
jgi:hypothetical protein